MRVPRFADDHPYTRHYGRVYDPQLKWDGADLVNEAIGDIYSSRGEGIGETDAVFVQGNRLAERFNEKSAGFCVAELGFGTGLNFFRTWKAWEHSTRAAGMLTYFSTEHAPLSKEWLRDAWAPLCDADPSLREPIRLFERLYPVDPHPGFHIIPFLDARITLVLCVGDGLRCLEQWDAGVRGVQAWYLDGFAPSKNPDFWNPEICAQIARHSRPGTTFSTYTAAGSVKRGLSAVGFAVQKVPGFGRKFERLQGQFVGDASSQPQVERTETRAFKIIGAGIAGCSLASSLAQRGAEVELVDQGSDIGSGASGNPHGFWRVRPNLLSLATAPVTRRLLEQESTTPGLFGVTGALDVYDQKDTFQKAIQRHEHWQLTRQGSEIWDADRIRAELPDRSDALSGPLGGIMTAQSGWLRPREWCELKTSREGTESRTDLTIVRKFRTNVAHESNSSGRQQIWCTGAYDSNLANGLSAVAGTVFFGTSSPLDPHPALSVHGNGFLGPQVGCEFTLGTTYERTDQDPWEQVASRLERNWNLARASWAYVSHRRSLRASTPDRQPILGAHTNGDWLLTGLGSHGMSLAPALAEHLASWLTGGPALLPKTILDALEPNRFRKNPERSDK